MSEKTKRKEEWIKIYTPEGKDMIASPQYVKNLLGIKEVDLSNLYNRLQRLEYQIERLASPGRQKRIIELLRENGKHNLEWIRNRVINYQGYDLDELIDTGLIVMTKSGTHPMFSLCDARA